VRNVKLHWAAENSSENEDTNKVSMLNVVPQNKIQPEDEIKMINTRVGKVEEDIINILGKLDEILISINNKI
jgi:hypothetical protein